MIVGCFLVFHIMSPISFEITGIFKKIFELIWFIFHVLIMNIISIQ